MSQVTLRANATVDLPLARRTDIGTAAFFAQSLRAFATRLGPRRVLVLDCQQGRMRIDAAQLNEWARVGLDRIDVNDLPNAVALNLALLCDDLASQFSSWSSLRAGELHIQSADYTGAYAAPARAADGSIPGHSPLLVALNPTAPAATLRQPQPAVRAQTTLSRDEAAARVRSNPSAYRSLPAVWRDDAAIALLAMQQPNGGNYVSSVPRRLLESNDAIAREAVWHSPNGEALASLGPRYLADTGFIRSLFSKPSVGHIDISFASAEVRADAQVRQACFESLVPASVRSRFSAIQREQLLSVAIDMHAVTNAMRADALVAGTLRGFSNFGVFDTELGGRPLFNIDVWCVEAEVRNNVTPLITQINQLNAVDRAALAQRVLRAHIAIWDRFASLAVLRETLDAIEQRNDPSRPTLLMLVSRSDHNGAMQQDIEQARRLFPNYRFVYREVSSSNELLFEVAAQAPHPAELLVISAHGTRTEATLGPQGWPRRALNSRVLNAGQPLNRARRGVARGARVYTLGCSNGEGRAEDGNMVNTLAVAFPQAQASGGASVVLSSLSRDRTGLVLDVGNPRVRNYTVPPLDRAVHLLPLR